MTIETEGALRDDDVEDAATPSRAVVVGVDGSETSAAAAQWAAHEALRRKLPLRVVHATPPVTPGAFPTALATAAIDWKGRAESLLGITTRPLHQEHPELAIEARAYIGQPPALALTGDAQSAEPLVLGSRGRGGFASLLLGSTAVQVLEVAKGPVVVVRQASRRHRRVIPTGRPPQRRPRRRLPRRRHPLTNRVVTVVILKATVDAAMLASPGRQAPTD